MEIWEEKVSGKICPFCDPEGKELNNLHFVTKLGVSKLYLFKDQTFLGRCVIVYDQHMTELYQLEESQRNQYYQDMLGVAEALNKAFKPNKLNYIILGDISPHLHWHLVPRYKNDPYWGQNFLGKHNSPTYLEEEEYVALAEKIKNCLNKKK